MLQAKTYNDDFMKEVVAFVAQDEFQVILIYIHDIVYIYIIY